MHRISIRFQTLNEDKSYSNLNQDFFWLWWMLDAKHFRFMGALLSVCNTIPTIFVWTFIFGGPEVDKSISSLNMKW